MRICNGCGSVRGPEHDECQICHQAGPDSVVELSPGDESPVAVLFQGFVPCGACGFETPINCFELSGSLRCNNCGIEQRFPATRWHSLLALGHVLADLGGVGRSTITEAEQQDASSLAHALEELTGTEDEKSVWFQHWKDLAREIYAVGQQEQVFSHRVMDGRGNGTELALIPGHPVCHDCHVPLDLQLADDSTGSLSCPRCDWSERYQLPPGEHPPGLALACAPEHRPGTMDAKPAEGADAGTVALSCPSCGGGLPIPDKGHFAACPFCETTVHFSPRVLGTTGKPDEARSWWLLFTGPSELRKTTLENIAWAEQQQEREQSRFDAEKQRDLAEVNNAGKSKRSKGEKALIWIMVIVFGGIGLAAILRAAIGF